MGGLVLALGFIWILVLILGLWFLSTTTLPGFCGTIFVIVWVIISIAVVKGE